ncbi:alpha-mannosidase [Abortiporus biennis]|nr:alpha-mannosidase [Abortiporus biennis]
MKWPSYWPHTFLVLILVCLENASQSHSRGLVQGARTHWTSQRKLDARDKTKDLWYHGYTSYMRFGRGPDWHNPANIAANDVAGNFSVTLIDSLDTLAVLNDTQGFQKAVRNVIDWVSFDVNTKPQVFETTIRVMGGLLSGHQLANQTAQPFYIPWYRGELLAMARDLGDRLLPAFKTPTGLPYARINLRHGVLKGESLDTCTAGAGSLILEFGTLSRLTGDDRYEKAAYKAFFALWNRKTEIGLVGNSVSIYNGAWLHPEVSNIGAGIDSFFEYALKWYILSGEVEFLDVWQEAYAAIMRYSRAVDGFWGDAAYSTVDSLSAFWPGLQVLAGDIENAVKSHLIYWNLWQKFSGLPEMWDMNFKQAVATQYPLRPEFIESTWYLYRATRDPFYLDVGERILHDIINRSKVECGLASIGDLQTNRRDYRMESFVLSETLKYLYLLFDEENPLHNDDSNYVLTTEGHILTMPLEQQKPISAIRRRLRGVEHLQCPTYQSPTYAFDNGVGLTAGIRARVDYDYARELIGTLPSELDQDVWSPNGWCEVPKVDLYSYDFILSPAGEVVPEDIHPSPNKLSTRSDGFLLQNVSGIRTRIVSRLDGRGYDVTKLGPFSVKSGQIVYVNDSSLFLAPFGGKTRIDHNGRPRRVPEVDLRIFLDHVDPMLQVQPGFTESRTETFVVAFTSMFGADPALPQTEDRSIQFGHGEGVRLVRVSENPRGCQLYNRTFEGEALVVYRGECTFLEKLITAKLAGAAGVVVINDEERGVNPAADADAVDAVGDSLDDVVLVVVGRADGAAIVTMLDAAEEGGLGEVKVAIASKGEPVDNSKEQERDGESGSQNRVLYLNGHPLLNTRLLV